MNQKPLLTLFFWLTLLAAPIALALSRNVTFLILLITALLGIASALGKSFGREHRIWQRSCSEVFARLPIGTASLVGFLMFAAISLAWTPELQRGVNGWLQITMAIIATLIAINVRSKSHPVVSLGLVVTLSAASCLIVFELANGSPVRVALGGTAETFRLNRAAVAIAIMVPLLFLRPTMRAGWGVNLCVLGLVWFAIFSSESESAKLAITIVTLVLLVSTFVKASTLLNVCACSVLLLHIFAPALAWVGNLYVPQSFFDAVGYPYQSLRLHIWWAFSSTIADAWLFGQGIQGAAAAAASHPEIGLITLPRWNYTFHPLGGVHPHNFSIQVWYELGAIGVALTTTIFVSAWWNLRALDDRRKKVAASLLAGIWTVTYVSHGAWQHWWWALVGIVIILFVALARQDEQDI